MAAKCLGVGLACSLVALVLLIVANVGMTFGTGALPRIYFASGTLASTGVSVRYGLYNACIYSQNETRDRCTSPSSLTFDVDPSQLSEVIGVDNITDRTHPGVDPSFLLVPNASHKGGVLILPATIFAFFATLAGLAMVPMRKNTTLPFFGAFAGALGFACGIICLALLLFTYWTILDAMESQFEGFHKQWGPTVYLTGIGSGLLFVSTIAYTTNCLARQKDSQGSIIYHR